MPYILNIDEIKSHIKLSDIPGLIGITLNKKGKTYKGVCPNPGCNHPTGLEITYWQKFQKDGYKCFHCDISGTDGIEFLTSYGNMDFQTAVKKVAELYNINIKYQEETKKAKISSADSFMAFQLHESGIPLKSIKILSGAGKGKEGTIALDEFEIGSLDTYGNLVNEDDMIINYVDLEYNLVTFRREKSVKDIQFRRVRYKNPELHKDKDGKIMKYASPYGSGTQIFIPEELRKAFHAAQKIDTLYFEEGEKKAKKKTIHGMFSIGFTGIHGIARNGQLPYDVIRILEKCEVKRVVFCLDSDWKDIMIKPGKAIDERPKSFRTAIMNFRDYFKALSNQGIDLDIFVCAIHPEHNAKGSDDLLAGPLKMKEEELKTDLYNSIILKDGKGKYVQFYRVAERTDTQIAQLLNLESGKSLALAHKDKLKSLPKFKVGNTWWKFTEKGELELAQPISEQEKFWKVFMKNDVANYQFRYVGLRNFLHSRGFWKYALNERNYIFVKEDGKILHEVNPSYVRNFVNEFIWEANLPEEVDELMMRGGDQYIGERKLEGIKLKAYDFEKPKDMFQRLIFKTEDNQLTSLEASAEGIEQKNLTMLPYFVWNNNIIDCKVDYVGKPLLSVKIDNKDEFDISFTEDGFECDFLRYLFVTSSFSHNKILNFRGKMADGNFTPNTLKEKVVIMQKYPEEYTELKQHFLNKITTFGFLLHRYRDANVLKAVVCMDGKESEVGSSFGRSGKSIYGETFMAFLKVLKRNGKNKKLTENPHNFAKIDERTALVFIDDCTVNFDFEYFFPFITGHVEVNPKGKEEIDIPREKTPKLIFTTNHAFSGHGDSFDDRQIVLTFSDYFNKDYKPIQEFGGLLMDDWNAKQWNLFYNFCTTALHLYFKFKRQYNGPIPGPMKKAQMRKMRQEMSEYFVQWADDYFDPEKEECKLNIDIEKNKMYEEFKNANKKYEQFNPIQTFKTKLKIYCKYKGYIFNPGKPLRDDTGAIIQEWGGDKKTRGIEYIHIHKPEEVQKNANGVEADSPF